MHLDPCVSVFLREYTFAWKQQYGVNPFAQISNKREQTPLSAVKRVVPRIDKGDSNRRTFQVKHLRSFFNVAFCVPQTPRPIRLSTSRWSRCRAEIEPRDFEH